MTHEDYLSKLDALTDEDTVEVLAHASSCAACARDARLVDKALARLEPNRRSLPEEVARWATVAALLAVMAFGLRSEPAAPAALEKTASRYRIVGDASGVVAYTPGGIVMGTAAPAPSKEVLR